MKPLLISLAIAAACHAGAIAEEATLWIGTTTPRDGESKGIYRATLNLATGRLSTPELAAEIAAPGFVALHPNGKQLYAVCRLPGGEGGVAAFDIDPETKSLTPRNTQPIGDGGAAHIAVDRTGACLFTAQYGGGSVAVFPLDAGGDIGPRSMLLKHEGSGPNPQRQRAPHAHWAGVSPDNRFLFVPDLGIDRVMIYRLDAASARIEPHGEGVCPPGSGPRHMKFHPDKPYAYVLNELLMSITVFRYDADAGALEPIQTISTLPRKLWGDIENKASEIRVHPNGRFVYAANRGHDSIAAFRIDAESGRLSFIERQDARAAYPRNFNIDPSGKWLLAGGRDSNNIAVFEIDGETGGLTYTGASVPCPTPICLEF